MFYRLHYDHTNFSCLEDLPGLKFIVCGKQHFYLLLCTLHLTGFGIITIIT